MAMDQALGPLFAHCVYLVPSRVPYTQYVLNKCLLGE